LIGIVLYAGNECSLFLEKEGNGKYEKRSPNKENEIFWFSQLLVLVILFLVSDEKWKEGKKM